MKYVPTLLYAIIFSVFSFGQYTVVGSQATAEVLPEKNRLLPISLKSKSPKIVYTKLNKRFKLRFNQTAFIKSEDLQIKFIKVAGDSRCPSGVTCFWRGVAIIEINAVKDKVDLGNFKIADYDLPSLSDGGLYSEIYISKYKINLLKVEPYSAAFPELEFPKLPKDTDYVATLVITVSGKRNQ